MPKHRRQFTVEENYMLQEDFRKLSFRAAFNELHFSNRLKVNAATILTLQTGLFIA